MRKRSENDRKEERLIEQYIKTTKVNIKKKKLMVLKRKSKNDYENKVNGVMETETISKNGIKMNNVMNKFLSSLIFAIFVIGIAINAVSCHKGDGDIITSEKTVSSFDEIHISSSANVHYYPSEETRVVVTVDENLLKYVKITEKNNVLQIGTKNGNYLFTKFMVDVYCPYIKEITVSGSGSFESLDKIVVSAFESKISGSGNIKGNFECDNFSIHISGSGNATVSGNAKNLDVNISGSGKFNGREFKTDNADIRISGSGNVYIWVVDYLKAHISGSGNIIYRGNPKIDFSGSGSGQLKSE